MRPLDDAPEREVGVEGVERAGHREREIVLEGERPLDDEVPGGGEHEPVVPLEADRRGLPVLGHAVDVSLGRRPEERHGDRLGRPAPSPRA